MFLFRFLIPAILFGLTGAEAQAVSAANAHPAVQCKILSALLPKKVSFPNSPTYAASILSYWFQQARLAPACVVTPTSTLDVSIIVGTLNIVHKIAPGASPFAIRGGGHAQIAGSANSNGGVTIDLTSLKSIKLNSDHTVTSVGGGTLWNNIYAQLDPLNVTVSGGRVVGIGVGGLTTGGGISFFSPERGWACDGIVGMEVVLASGQAVYTSASQRPDLFKALKGGSNNFGIVTRFDLKTFPQGKFLGGFIFNFGNTAPAQLEAFDNFMKPENFDPHATIIQAYNYATALGQVVVANGMEYTLPVVDPPALANFTSIAPQLANTMRISSHSDFVKEEGEQQAVNPRGLYYTTTFTSNLDVLKQIFDLWSNTLPSIKDAAGIVPSLVFQRIPSTVPGSDNSLGLGPSAGSLVLCLLSIAWSDAADDALINKVTSSLLAEIEKVTIAAGVYNKFKYLNYAAKDQAPLDSYGAANKKALQAVSKKYDPAGLFQRGVPGGFKLF